MLLVSAEPAEILALSDRIAVMFKGKINSIVSAAESTRDSVGLMMSGVVAEDAVAAPVEDAHVNRA